MKRHVIAVYVENKYGVLTRVAGMFMRRGFNIDALAVGETQDPAFSRITITLTGDDHAREQLITQLNKLHNVKKVKLLNPERTVERELLLIKLSCSEETRAAVAELAETYHATILPDTPETLLLQLSGTSAQITEFLERANPFGIVEMCRTGCIALEQEIPLLEE